MPTERLPASGVPLIDFQHRALFERLTALSTSPRADAPRELALFIDQVRAHFRTEEELLERHGYPELPKHRAEHAAFSAELDAIAAGEVGPATVAFLRGWLVNHNMDGDRHYADWIAPATSPRSAPRKRGRAWRAIA